MKARKMKELADAEEKAREKRPGLWADPEPIPPCDVRRKPTETGDRRCRRLHLLAK